MPVNIDLTVVNGRYEVGHSIVWHQTSGVARITRLRGGGKAENLRDLAE